MYPIKKFFGLLVLIIGISMTSSAQCKGLVKKNLTRLAPFTHNGQLNSASLPEGGVVDFKLTCYTGMTYRLALASEQILGKVSFRVLDEDNNEVYNSNDNNTTSWDFNVGSSQELTVEISVPLTDKTIRGCVALLVGFKEQKPLGALRPM